MPPSYSINTCVGSTRFFSSLIPFTHFHIYIHNLVELLRRNVSRTALGGILHRRNILAITLGLLTGILLLLVGYINPLDYTGYIIWIWQLLGLPSQYLPIALFVNTVLQWLASFGGITVIVGAILVALKIERIGRWLIGIGAGMSILTFIWRIVSIFIGLAPLGSLLTGFNGVLGVALVLAIITEELIIVEGI
jgi:hypothetical protein